MKYKCNGKKVYLFQEKNGRKLNSWEKGKSTEKNNCPEEGDEDKGLS